jgi:hypothetical protein
VEDEEEVCWAKHKSKDYRREREAHNNGKFILYNFPLQERFLSTQNFGHW